LTSRRSADGTAQIDFLKTATGDIESLTIRTESFVSPTYLRTVEKTAPFKTTAFFVRGRMNNWSTSAPCRPLLTTLTPHVF
jgi:hypothetical protein